MSEPLLIGDLAGIIEAKDLTALLRPTEANVPTIYARAQTAHSLVIRALTYQAESRELAVSLNGLKSALVKLQAVCKDTAISIQ